MPHARLRGKMDDVGKPMCREKCRSRGSVGEVQPDELKILRLGQLRETRLLELRIIVVGNAVDADDVATSVEQAARDMKTDEAGSAGDEALWPLPAVKSRSSAIPRDCCRTPERVINIRNDGSLSNDSLNVRHITADMPLATLYPRESGPIAMRCLYASRRDARAPAAA